MVRAKSQHLLDLSEFDINIEEPTKETKSSDLVNELKKLNELYQEGALTKKEFEKAKRKLLD